MSIFLEMKYKGNEKTSKKRGMKEIKTKSFISITNDLNQMGEK